MNVYNEKNNDKINVYNEKNNERILYTLQYTK